MRIAIIGQKGIPTKSGGVERHVEELATRLVREGHEVVVYARKSYNNGNRKQYKGVNLVYIPSVATKNLDAITYTFLATVHAIFQPYDVVHYHSIGPASLSWMIRLFKKSSVLIGTFHSQDYDHKKWGWFARMYFHIGEYVICRVPNKTIAISKSLVRYIKENHNKKAVYIPNGSQANAVKSEEKLSQWGLKKGRYILSVSRLVRHKGIHFLIEAFKQLEDAGKVPDDFKLVIVGASSGTDEYVQHLKEISRGRKNIVFTGEQSGNSLHELFSHAYLFAQPSLAEGLSIALLESMGYGISALVSDIPENAEAIGQSGFRFKSGDQSDLAKRLECLFSVPEEVQLVGDAAKRRAQKEYHWDVITQKTLEVYKEAVLEKCMKQYSVNARKVS